jgi:hypothetical protein
LIGVYTHLAANLHVVWKQALLGAQERQADFDGADEGMSVGTLGAVPLGASGTAGGLKGGAMGAAVGDATGAAMGDDMGDATGTTMGDATGATTGDAMGATKVDRTGVARGADLPHTMVNVTA